MSALIVPYPATSSGASRRSTKAGTFSNSTARQRPSRHSARARTGPAGVSTVTIVSGSVIATRPASSSTVTVQIRLEPDIATYSVGSMMMTPASQPGCTGGTRRLTWRHTRPRGSHSSRRRMWSWARSMVRIFSNMVAPAGGSTPPMITSPTSPSAWQPMTDMTRLERMNWLLPNSRRPAAHAPRTSVPQRRCKKRSHGANSTLSASSPISTMTSITATTCSMAFSSRP